MKFRKSVLLLFPAGILFAFSACKKDEDDNTTSPTKLQLLTAQGWKLDQVFEDSIDITNDFFSPCDMDNIYSYKADNTYSIDEGPTKCLPTDPQINETGTWTFANNQGMLVLNSGSAFEADLTILQLDANTLKLKEIEYDPSAGTSSTYIFHFVKN